MTVEFSPWFSIYIIFFFLSAGIVRTKLVLLPSPSMPHHYFYQLHHHVTLWLRNATIWESLDANSSWLVCSGYSLRVAFFRALPVVLFTRRIPKSVFLAGMFIITRSPADLHFYGQRIQPNMSVSLRRCLKIDAFKDTILNTDIIILMGVQIQLVRNAWQL